MDGKYYAVSNLNTIAENINDPYGELYDQIERTQKAVKRLAN